jgi:hypothetical protein
MFLRSGLVVACFTLMACAEVSEYQGEAPDASVPVEPPDAAPVEPQAVMIYVHSRDALYSMDDQSFELNYIGDFGIDENMTDLAVTPDGRLFGITGTAIYLINHTTGAAGKLVDVPGVLNVGLTFLPSGTLLATDKEGGVREISPDTGDISEIGKFGGGWGTAGDLVAVADGTMYAIGEYENEQPGDSDLLLIVDTADGSATWVGEIGHGDVFGVAYANGKVYAFTDGGAVIEIGRLTGKGTLVKNHPVQFWGAAVSPLVRVD